MSRLQTEYNMRTTLDKLKQRMVYTPDFFKIKEFAPPLIPMFVFGKEKKGKTHESLLEDARFFGKALTTSSNSWLLLGNALSCVMFKYSVSDEATKELAYGRHSFTGVQGELYGVNLSQLCVLDMYCENNVKVERQEISIMVENGNQTHYTTAYTYVAIPSKWDTRTYDPRKKLFPALTRRFYNGSQYYIY